MVWFELSVLKNAAGAHVTAVVVGLGVLALGNTAAACRVDEVERVVLVDTGHDAHVADASASRAALEEHQVARLQVILLDAHTIRNLSPRRAVQADAETLEHVTGKSRAVKAAGRGSTITVRRTAETVCVTDELVYDVAAIVLLDLLEHSTLLAVRQPLCLCRKTGNGDCKKNE